MMGRFDSLLKSVILRVSELRDLGSSGTSDRLRQIATHEGEGFAHGTQSRRLLVAVDREEFLARPRFSGSDTTIIAAGRWQQTG